MRKLLVSTAAAAVLASSSLAFAAAMHNTSGIVKAFDTKAMTLTLANGRKYMLPKNFKDPGLKAGDKVSISWDTKNGSRVAETVKIVP
jgi:Cu/Ag efflux protein CusF